VLVWTMRKLAPTLQEYSMRAAFSISGRDSGGTGTEEVEEVEEVVEEVVEVAAGRVDDEEGFGGAGGVTLVGSA
jgi:hypothetical protein